MENEIREEIRALDNAEDNSIVSIIWIRSGQTHASLFQLIAGSISKQFFVEKNGITMSTHIVFNDLLFEFIEEYCEKYLSSLASDEKESLLANNSKFLVTTSLPTYEPLSSADSDDSGDDLCYFTCDRNNILTPKLDKDPETGEEAYIYELNDVKLVIGKPETKSVIKP